MFAVTFARCEVARRFTVDVPDFPETLFTSSVIWSQERVIHCTQNEEQLSAANIPYESPEAVCGDNGETFHVTGREDDICSNRLLLQLKLGSSNLTNVLDAHSRFSQDVQLITHDRGYWGTMA